MGKCNDIDKVLKRNGTGQGERFVAQLRPSLFELNDFDVEDWILFTYNFAKHVNYFDTRDSDTIRGDWQEFFNYFDFDTATIPFRASRAYKRQKEHITEVLAGFKKEGTLTSHLTLFVSFLQLLEQSKSRFNGITKRHLDFYYKDVLQVDKRAATPDQAHVIFELAKKSIEQRIVEDTELNGKQDANGNLRIYKTEEELIANQAKVTSLKTVYQSGALKEIKASPNAKTLDGFEEPLLESEPYWLPFGYTSEEKKFPELPDAEVGFAIASPLLLLKEGIRKVDVTLDFDPKKTAATLQLDYFKSATINSIITLYASGAEEWIGPILLIGSKISKVKNEVGKIILDRLVLSFELSKDIPAVVNYNDAFLLQKYNTTFPVVRFLVDTSQKDGVLFQEALTRKILRAITLKVAVEEASSVHIENDNGILKQAKPFFPFTPQPIKESNFYIDCEEAFAKAWKNITVHFSWKNTPNDFSVWYNAYKKNAIPGKTSTDPIVTSKDYFTATKEILHKEKWITVGNGIQKLFEETAKNVSKKTEETEKIEVPLKSERSYHCNVEVDNNNAFDIDKTGPIRLRLNTSFLHDVFPRLYAAALIGNTVSTTSIENGAPVVKTITTEGNIPNPPYTPIAETITISYTAEETRYIQSHLQPIDEITPAIVLEQKNGYENERIKLFHIHAFGQCEEHNYLKIKQQKKGIKDVYDGVGIHSYLVPRFCNGGELYIGLEDAQVQQNLALLIQVLEGSENPQVASFGEREEIQWAILCDNAWKSLTDDILSNNTDNFLNSGIIKFAIPRQATQENTRLPEGYMWVRAKMHKAYDAVCKAIDIHTQAVLATFEDRGNELSHLDKGLEAGSIKKLITRIPQVKGLNQPYSSFNGIPEESDMRFYRRISERLRHKNRAITLWDYEHLILQEFPEIFKVKCLNHTLITHENDTTKDNYIAAGHVTLVVIPDSVNKNVFDIYQPRVSKGLIARIKSFINQYNTSHVTADVINPRYEEVAITLEVEFLKGYDEHFYNKQLEKDIIKFLSPWAFDTTQEVVFGIDLHRSILIDYIEKLSYVDYLQNVRIQKNGLDVGNVVTPSNPRSILVSAKSHTIHPVKTPCKDKTAQENVLCQ